MSGVFFVGNKLDIGSIDTITGTVAVSGGGGGVQYTINTTAIAATGTGTLVLGIQSGATTARGLALTTTGGVFNVQTVATITTLLGTVAVSGGGGGAQYSAGATNMGATATGTVILAVIGTTAKSVLVDADSHLQVDVLSGGGGGQQYPTGSTGLGSTGTGTLVLGVVGTTARALGVNTTGGLTYLDNVGNISTGTLTISAGNISLTTTPPVYATGAALGYTATGILMMGEVGGVAMPLRLETTGGIALVEAVGTINSTVTISGTVTALPSGTQSVILVSGTITAMPVVSATGVLLAATTAVVGAFVATAHGSRWDAYAVNTTSGSSIILKTSGAHTLYITDLLLSVDVPMMVTLMSAATTKMVAYFATKGGLVIDLNSPMVLNTAQSLTFQGNASGSCAGFAAGFTVT